MKQHTHDELRQFLPKVHDCGGCGKEMQIALWRKEWFGDQPVQVTRSFCDCGKVTTTIIGGEWQ